MCCIRSYSSVAKIKIPTLVVPILLDSATALERLTDVKCSDIMTGIIALLTVVVVSGDGGYVLLLLMIKNTNENVMNGEMTNIC